MENQVEESSRNFVVSHQILSISRIDFENKAIYVSNEKLAENKPAVSY